MIRFIRAILFWFTRRPPRWQPGHGLNPPHAKQENLDELDLGELWKPTQPEEPDEPIN